MFLPKDTSSIKCHLISWNNTAKKIKRQLEINQGYFIIDGNCFIIFDFEISERKSKATYGTIVELGSDQMAVATLSYDVIITKIGDLANRNCHISKLKKYFDICVGDRVRSFDYYEYEIIIEFTERIRKHERFWKNQLANKKSTANFPTIIRQYSEIETCPNLVLVQSKYFDSRDHQSILPILLIYLFRINNYDAYTINYSNHILKNPLPVLKALLAEYVPLTIDFKVSTNFTDVLSKVSRVMKKIKENKTYTNDIYTKYTNLSVTALSNIIGLVEVKSIKDYKRSCNSSFLEFVITRKESALHLYADIRLKSNCSKILISIMDSIANLFCSCTNHPFESVNQFPLVTLSQRKTLMNWNLTKESYPKKTVSEIFEEQVKRTPSNVAVVFNAIKVTYSRLNQEANKLARFLKKLGAKPGVFIAIYLERHLNVIISILGILKAGAAYVPIDSDYPSSRVSFILKDCSVSILLTQSGIYNGLRPTYFGKVVFLDQEKERIKKEKGQNLLIRYKSNKLAYVIYTSGSSGIPKGVAIEDSSIVNMALYHVDKLKIGSQDKVLQFVSISFDVMTADVIMTLLGGAELYLFSKDQLIVGPKLIETIRKNAITVAMLPNAVLKILDPDELPCLKRVVSGGETCSSSTANKWLRRSRLFINAYGPTEATVCATMAVCKVNKEVTIGKPCPNVQIYILDKYKQLMPIGTVGELYIGGVGVARGYLNRTDLTKKSFIKDLFKEGNGRLYKTGDMGMWLSDGNIQYMGRIDSQVKFHGFRIELEEINNHLRKYPGVEQTVTLVKEGNRYLISYLVLHNKIDPSTDLLKEYLKKFLPYYMIPSVFVILDSFPLTSNGKVDTKELLDIEIKGVTGQGSYISPSTKTELWLAKLWSEILGIENGKVGTQDSFLQLGGDSLTSAKLVLEINSNFHINITIGDLFDFPTISALSKKIDTSAPSESLTITKASGKSRNYFPLSFSQEMIYLHQKLGNNSVVYNEPAIVHIDCNLNVIALENALNEIVKRHEILRTNIVVKNGDIRQIIRGYNHFKIPYFELSDERSALNVAESELKKPFNMEIDPLIRFILIKLSEKSFKLFIVAHHIIFDGVALSNVFMHELDFFYKSFSNKRVSLKKPPLQYKDYCVWQRKYFTTKNTQKHIAYWKKQLANLQLLTFPTKPSVTKRSTEGKLQILNISNVLTKKIEKLSRKEGVTVFMTLFAAFNVLLYRYTGHKDIAVGTVVAGRSHPEIEMMMGNFLNTIILRNKISGTTNFKELLQSIKKTTTEAWVHQELHFSQLLKMLNIERNSEEFLPFSVSFIFEPKIRDTSLGWKLTQTEIHSGTSKFNLMFELDHRLTGIIGRIEYNEGVFDDTFIRYMINHYQIILESVVENVCLVVDEIPILTRLEKKKVLERWNNTQVDYSKKTIHELFEEQVEKAPEGIALSFENITLNYQRLNQKANKLAHFLKNMKIGSNKFIAVYLNDRVSIIVSLLAILKIGSAYIPIDSSYPNFRVGFMLEDSQPSILITRKKLFSNLSIKYPGNVVYLDESKLEISEQSDINLSVSSKTNDLAYIIYTSGSTGKPKGILQKHETITNLVSWQSKHKTTTHLNVAQFANYSFDVSLQEIFYALLNGYRLNIVPDNVKQSIGKIVIFLLKTRVNILFLPTSLLNLLAYEAILTGVILPDLQEIIVAGETLKITENVRSFFEGNKHIKLVNHYGPSETHVVTSYALPNTPKNWPLLPAIGKPISNARVYILNRKMNPNPVNVVGEIYVAGNMLANGYLDQAALTREKFIDDPMNISSKLYKTGDFGYWTYDGNIIYVGRSDNQIKIRGFRIEIEEIEQILLQCPFVQECVVVAEKENNNRLVAYISNDNKSTIEDIRTFLSIKLPKYMIPDLFVILDRFPLNKNGKIDRKALSKALCVNDGFNKKQIDLPKTDNQKKLARMWSEVLNIDLNSIGINDDFFEIGGHSLASLQLLLMIKKKFNVRLELQDIFKYSTIFKQGQIIFDKTHSEKVLKNENNSVVLLKEGNKTKSPLFLVHPIGGTVFWYQTLAKYLSTDRIIYGIQDPGIFLQDKLFKDICEMADCYLKLIKNIQKKGSYLLGGASFGGTVAVEIAQQLKQKGEQVDTVILFDSWAKYPEDVKEKVYLEEGLRQMHKILIQKSSVKNIENIDFWLKLQRNRVELLWNYNIPLVSRIVLFKAITPLSYFKKMKSSTNFWGKYSVNIKKYLIPGNHETIFSYPNVKILAEKLDAYLQTLEDEL